MASVNSSTSTTSLLTAKTGIGGLVSGMDIDELVESLSATSRQKIIKQQQNVQRLEWKQTAYRSVTKALKEFQSKYLDVLSPTNFRSTSFFNTVKASSSSAAVTVSATSTASEGTITINSIQQLATAQTVKSAAAVSTAMASNTSFATIASNLSSLEGKSFGLTLDGKLKTITFDEAFITAAGVDGANLQTALQGAINTAFGTTELGDPLISVSSNGDVLSFTAEGSTIKILAVGDDSDTLQALGFSNGQSNKLTTSSTLAGLSLSTALAAGDYSVTINNVFFNFKSTDTLSTVIERINTSKAGVTLAYSSITDKFTMTADETGSGSNIMISENNGNLLTAFGLTSAAGAEVTEGKNAILTVNDQTIIRSSNTFELDGAKVTLNKEAPAEEITLTMAEDATSLFDSVKKFVDDYNSMVDLVNGLVKENKESDYAPLTDEQREEMSETEITAWEKKAKQGILRGDSLLRGISSKLQSVVTGMSVNGISLYNMGITSAGYSENGKLQINETKLKDALETKGSEIRDMFTSANGIGAALNDIITNATKTSGVRGTRGTLVEAAGVDSTTSNTENSIFDQIKRINKSISTLKVRLEDEESRLWNKFTYMETIINNLNAQSSVLSSFSSGS